MENKGNRGNKDLAFSINPDRALMRKPELINNQISYKK